MIFGYAGCVISSPRAGPDPKTQISICFFNTSDSSCSVFLFLVLSRFAYVLPSMLSARAWLTMISGGLALLWTSSQGFSSKPWAQCIPRYSCKFGNSHCCSSRVLCLSLLLALSCTSLSAPWLCPPCPLSPKQRTTGHIPSPGSVRLCVTTPPPPSALLHPLFPLRGVAERAQPGVR